MRKWFMVLMVALLCVALLAAPAAAKKRRGDKSYFKGKDFQAGADLGTYVYGAIPYASLDAGDQDGSFYGIGGFGPVLGAHFNLYASSFIVHFDAAYTYQSGSATINWKDEDIKDSDFDYRMALFRGSAGFGRPMFETDRVMPYWLLGISLSYMSFRDLDEDKESATGTGFGPFGALGVDGAVYRQKGFVVYVGGQARADLQFTINPLSWEKGDEEVKIIMGYLPISFLLTGGINF